MAWHHRFVNFFRSGNVSRQIEREIEFHITERAEALRAEGWPEQDALLEARRRFGNRGIQAERTRDADVIGWLDALRADVRYALRALWRTPVFTAVAVASLAIGIGANTAIYTLIDTLVLRSLPVPQPELLVQVTFGGEDSDVYFTNPLWEQVRDRQTGLSAVAAFGDGFLNTADGGEARFVRATWISGDYFTVFGLPPAAGRLIQPSDDVGGCTPVAVLGHGYWRSELGGARDAIGRTIRLEGIPFEIVGVSAEGFTGTEVGRETQVFVPICAQAAINGPQFLEARSMWWLRVVGRREPRLALEQVDARLASIASAVYGSTVPPDWPAERQTEYRERSLGAVGAERGMSGLRVQYSSALVALMGAVAIVLLIACANVANLLLARAAAREREVAIRLAIGAGRSRLVRQLMTESVVLATLGAAVGLLIAQWGARALVRLIASGSSPIALDLSLDPRVLGFTALTAAVTATIFGLAPAWRATRVSPQMAMSARGRGIAEGHGRFTAGKALVAVQVALSLVLLVGAGLLIGSLRNLATLDPGFRAEGVLLAGVDFSRAGREEPFALMRRQLLDRVRAIPGVQMAATADLTPLGGASWNGQARAEGATQADEAPLLWFNEVSDGYFAAMDIDLVAGRDFGPEDAAGTPKAVILNHSAARQLFGDASPIGRTVLTESGPARDEAHTVVGVVEDSKYRDLRESNSGTVYLAASQSSSPRPFATVIVRTSAPIEGMRPALTASATETHPLASLTITPLSRQVDASLRRERMLAVLSTLFAGVALLLSMLGLYGVMAYAVARRRNEIGVRIALGADRRRVLRLVLGDTGRVIAIGLALGAAGALSLGTVVRAFLYGLEPTDPSILAAAVVLLASVGLAAGLVPAAKAAGLDPVEALREE